MTDTVAVASHSFPKNPTLCRELLQKYPGAKFNRTGVPLGGRDLIEFLRGCPKAITGLEVLDEAVFGAVPELKIVSKYGVGLDMIDLAAARRHGVSVRWTPGVNRQAVAELTIALMIALARNLIPLTTEMRAGTWSRGGGRQISSAKVGIIGCGHVGKTVARIAIAFGATVRAHDIVAYDAFYRETGVVPVPLEFLLRESDFVSIHVPLDRTTRGMIGAAELALMKPSAFLINTARGGIVDEVALKRTLVDHGIGGAAFDVFHIEPPSDVELLALPNFVATPHVGASTAEAVLAMGRAAITGLDDRGREI